MPMLTGTATNSSRNGTKVMGPDESPAGSNDPEMMAMLDDIRRRLDWVFGAANGALSFAVSGTGTSGMEAAVANVTAPGTRALVVVTGYFGDRLAQLFQRYGATVSRLDVEWGRACDPAAVERALAASPADIIAVVHAETSTGAWQPLPEIAKLAHDHGALVLADCVTSLGGAPVLIDEWGIDAAYSGTQKCLSAPPGMAPLTLSGRAWDVARSREVPCNSWYLDRNGVPIFQSTWFPVVMTPFTQQTFRTNSTNDRAEDFQIDIRPAK